MDYFSLCSYAEDLCHTVPFHCRRNGTCRVVHRNNVYVSVQEPRAVRCKRPSKMTEFFRKLHWTVHCLDMLVAMSSEFDGSYYMQYRAGSV